MLDTRQILLESLQIQTKLDKLLERRAELQARRQGAKASDELQGHKELLHGSNGHSRHRQAMLDYESEISDLSSSIAPLERRRDELIDLLQADLAVSGG